MPYICFRKTEDLNTLDEFVSECHNRSVSAGWWDELVDLTESQRILMFAAKISLIHSEVSEMLEGLRKGRPDDHLPQYSAEAVEAADIFIRLADYCGIRNIDLAEAVRQKMEYNAVRADHKPEARAAAGGKKI